jgi:hypothetical protein
LFFHRNTRSGLKPGYPRAIEQTFGIKTAEIHNHGILMRLKSRFEKKNGDN